MSNDIQKHKNNLNPSVQNVITSTETKMVRTKIIDDVFTDKVAFVKPKFIIDLDAYIYRLWESNPEIHNILKESTDIEVARINLFLYLESVERKVFQPDYDLHILEKAIIRDSIRVFKSIIGIVNEERLDYSTLEKLWDLAHEEVVEDKPKVSVGFLMEFINLFRSIGGQSNFYLENGEVKRGIPEFLIKKGKEAAKARTEILDDLGFTVQKYFRKYPSGLEDNVVTWRKENKLKILRYFEGNSSDWNDYNWHLKNVICNSGPLLDLIEVSTLQKEVIEKAVKNQIPFGITPYYLSLIDSKLSIGYDHAVRAQVIPSPTYIDKMITNGTNRCLAFDFMGEHDTSPVDLVTRRYPMIAIFKPFNTCAQICVYCQRNWEIDKVLEPQALASDEKIDKAIAWFDEHPCINEVLITGGDPIIMDDENIWWILEKFAAKKQIHRIRIGTRTPVVLPMRWTDNLVKIISKFHVPGRREIAIVTHFEHSYEITPEAMEAVQKIRKKGISIYNQEVFTVENSRRFESAKLRKDLKLIGVDPYYTFNMKGKEETKRYMVPIARILQERKEEARLLPGLDRTDEPVFNVPRLGKNHLRAWQDHRLISILPDGARVYEFHPWEKSITPVPPYNYVDVPIYDYLEELAARGENIRDYRTIWFYY